MAPIAPMCLKRSSVLQVAEFADGNAAAGRLIHQVQAAQQSRFSGTGRAEQDCELTVLESEGGGVKRDKTAETY